MYARYYFLVARADDERPVSVPVGKCCLELFDADCGGCICWVSLGVRRYTPKIKSKLISFFYKQKKTYHSNKKRIIKKMEMNRKH